MCRCQQRLFAGHSRVVRASPVVDVGTPAEPHMSLAGLEACAKALRLCPIHVQPADLAHLFTAVTAQRRPPAARHVSRRPSHGRRSFTPMRRRTGAPVEQAPSSRTPDARLVSTIGGHDPSAGKGGDQAGGVTRGRLLTFREFQVLMVQLARQFFFKPNVTHGAQRGDRSNASGHGDDADCLLVLLLHCQHNEA